jgi:triacylglycerol lipase
MTARGDRTCRNHPVQFFAALLGIGIAVAGLMATSVARAQMPSDLAEKVAALGRVIDPPNTGKLYAPLQEKEPYAGVKLSRDVKYGNDARNVVDIFVPDTVAAAGRPVLMFVHGGGMIGGTKHAPGNPYYDNVMLFAAHHGMVGVNVEHRLAPQFPWPSGIEDLAAAVRFVADKAADFGVDPNRIYLMGHSSGAAHAALYVSHPEFFGPRGAGLAGAIFSSGDYDFTIYEGEGTIAYLGSDQTLRAQRSAVAGLIKTKIPFMMSSAELDPPSSIEQFVLLKDALCKSEHGCVRSMVLPKHSHMSATYSINTADVQFSDQILEFIKTGK